jgi:hypothetical protein
MNGSLLLAEIQPWVRRERAIFFCFHSLFNGQLKKPYFFRLSGQQFNRVFEGQPKKPIHFGFRGSLQSIDFRQQFKPFIASCWLPVIT